MKTLLLYTVILAIFGFGIEFAIRSGQRLQQERSEAVAIATPKSTPAQIVSGANPSLFAGLQENAREPLSRLFLQIVVIVVATRLAGSIVTRFGQPAVIGEMIAGILLGPSLFGWIAPQVFSAVFAPDSLGILKLLSQIGVCLFMFVVGMELDAGSLRHRAHTAVFVSHVSIVFPYFLGVVLSLLLYPSLAAAGASFTAFALFMGIAMSITAFPVLARILEERGMSKTWLGSTAITCAAVDDVTAWSILAFIVVIVRSGAWTSTALSLGLVCAFVAFMVFVVRPQLPRWFSAEALENGTPSKGAFARVLVFFVVSALSTEILGIHALFGAFLAGVVMPQQSAFRQALKLRLENFSSVFLLPLFFAFTGLRTQFGLLDNVSGWGICLGIILVATLGKLGGSMITARLTGMPWLESFRLGALMNTRGLMELIALNIGYDLGILSPKIFTMLVLMAMATTFLTGPFLNLADRLDRQRAPVPRAA